MVVSSDSAVFHWFHKCIWGEAVGGVRQAAQGVIGDGVCVGTDTTGRFEGGGQPSFVGRGEGRGCGGCLHLGAGGGRALLPRESGAGLTSPSTTSTPPSGGWALPSSPTGLWTLPPPSLRSSSPLLLPIFSSTTSMLINDELGGSLDGWDWAAGDEAAEQEQADLQLRPGRRQRGGADDDEEEEQEGRKRGCCEGEEHDHFRSYVCMLMDRFTPS